MSPEESLCVLAFEEGDQDFALDIAKRLGVDYSNNSEILHTRACVVCEGQEIWLSVPQQKKPLSVKLDFTGGAIAHRRKYSHGKNQLLGKAIGFGKHKVVQILDATAGQGRDALLMASLGAHVTLCERSSIAHIMLENAICRAKLYAQAHDPELGNVLSRLNLLSVDSLNFRPDSHTFYQVIYLDPMFPDRKKSALVKKEMKIFHELIGEDSDADGLLPWAMALAVNRVVVKRPRVAPYLNRKLPSYSLEGKSVRYDIYAMKKFED